MVLIAEKENKSNLNGLCDLLFGFTDLLSLMLIFLPLYPKPVDGYLYSVSLIEYVDSEIWIRMTYWGLFIALTIIGIVNILMVNFKFEKGKKVITFLSVGLSIITVLYLAIAREPYAVTVAFLLLLIKGGLLINELWPVDKELSHTNSCLSASHWVNLPRTFTTKYPPPSGIPSRKSEKGLLLFFCPK